MYFWLVRSMMSCGKRGGVPCLSQLAVSQSRTNCLSKLGWSLPASYSSPGQKRDESGVSTSSARTILPSMRPNSNFVSAMITPRSAAWSRAFVYTASARSRSCAASSSPTTSAKRSKLMFSS